MLWKKETSKNNAMYVDLYALNGGRVNFNEVDSYVRRDESSSTLNKNDAVSLQKRKQGNEYFSEGNWTDAMEMYSESLCYAENGSKNISLAYANRSACFLKMKLYNECLVDIELAKKAGYPADLMPNLDQRKEECLEAIKKVAPSMKLGSELSFESDEHFPCMANVLKIDQDAEGNLGIFAKKDIDVGQTIVVEKAFMTYLHTQYGSKCNICLKDQTNLVACKKCTVAMFCGECQSNSLHEYECGLRCSNDSQTNSVIMQTVRSCLLAIDMFSSVEDLMNFVEQAIKSDRNQIPTTLSGVKSQYAAFLKLPMNPADQNLIDVIASTAIAFTIQKILLEIPKINSTFKLKKYRRFLMHLITHHYRAMKMNSLESGWIVDEGNGEYVALASQTGVMKCYLKHSCAPNVVVTDLHGNIVIITVRPVKKGQQIMHSIYTDLVKFPKDERHRILWNFCRMTCKCARCEGDTAPFKLRKEMCSNPNFQYIVKQLIAPARNDDEAKQKMMDNCKRFLRKYGLKPWCEELGMVVQVYFELINHRQEYNQENKHVEKKSFNMSLLTGLLITLLLLAISCYYF
ncbi:SET and MYND domain-containing protein 4-like [Sitodiplosis mosellana]|uniref:SET and MYND domain-containing protein 4-like n=1 Tax=Sitodiplosis mosellana TaxID=263140 RepID=UPI002443EA05|nr:SET and MYND domain-containing protein 4-like [Sitodiplosis mosellana]